MAYSPGSSSAVRLLLGVGLLLLLLLAPACASTGGSGGSDRGEVTREELLEADASDAYQALQRLRPRWLRSRGVSSFDGQEASLPMVFVDGVEHGPVEELRSVNLNDVDRIEFMSAADATTRFGTGYPGGIIQVSTRR